MRKQPEVALGPKYVGSRVSREALLHDDSDESAQEDFAEGEDEEEEESAEEDTVDPDTVDIDAEEEDGEIDSSEALGESDDERFKEFAFRGSSRPKHGKSGRKERMTAADFLTDSEGEEATSGVDGSEDDEDEDMSEDNEDQDEDVEEDEENEENEKEEDSESDEDEDEDGDDETSRRAELRKMMSEEQKSVVATISQAAKADADKGNAVKQQRKAFDGLLNVRIRLQKALVATNSMSATDESTDSNEPYQAAEEAAIKLWNTLDGLRHELAKAGGAKTGQKRKRAIDADAASSKIWERMQDLEVSTLDNRQTTLEKWSSKVRGASALPLKGKLNNTAAQHTITDVLQEQLSNSERLVKRTKMPRSCAPVQAKAKVMEDVDIFDDADFYQMLLKELVDQRMMDSSATP